ncbi:MAG: histidinol dehydrogenase, partial [Clostridiales bacterium]|nr:histidinol dehydrogenase [Clostridiales bacterium]
MLKILNAKDGGLRELQKKRIQDYDAYLPAVSEILRRVKEGGDGAVFAYTKKFDKAEINAANFLVTQEEIARAYAAVEPETLACLRRALENIRKFHERQRQNAWLAADESGSLMGQLVTPIERAGIYVPGGTAPLLSSVLMNAVPATVAGVKEIVMVTPPQKDGQVNPYVLAAAAEAGVAKIFKAGGAQAVAALAYGTESVPKADVITGPGNIYVTLAKKLVYGEVNIDMLAGPSEILIIADSSANPVFLAADLLSQAEHDVLASAVLLSPDENLLKETAIELEKQLALLPRKEIAAQSLRDYGALVLTKDLDEAMELANEWAPEHLEIETAQPFDLLPKVKNAGSVFLGSYSAEPVGDY